MPTGEDTGTDCDGDPTDAPDGQHAGTATQGPPRTGRNSPMFEDNLGNVTGAGDAAGGTDDDGVGAGLVVTAVAVPAAALIARR